MKRFTLVLTLFLAFSARPASANGSAAGEHAAQAEAFRQAGRFEDAIRESKLALSLLPAPADVSRPRAPRLLEAAVSGREEAR